MPEERLTNIVTSSNPCPICASINGMTMTLEEWEASDYGVPGSDGRYCDGACHCILIPESLLPSFDWIDPNYIPRGDKGSSIAPIIEIFPNEKVLADLMNEWNLRFGRLPKEIYQMPVKDGWAYLKAAFDRRMAGGAAPITPPPAPPLPPVRPAPAPAPIPRPAPAPTPPPAPPKPAAAGKARDPLKPFMPTKAEIAVAKQKNAYRGMSDEAIARHVAMERRIWALNLKEKAKNGYGREWGVALDDNGKEIFFKKGQKSRVRYTWDEMKLIYQRGTTFLHNHPGDTTNSFSDADMGFMVTLNSKRMVVNSVGKRYVIIRRGSEWFAGQVARMDQAVASTSNFSANILLQPINTEAARYKSAWHTSWRKFKPSQADQDRVSDAAGAAFKPKADAAYAEWKRLINDPASPLDQRDSVWKEYQSLRAKETEARRIAREDYYYRALDRAMEDFASSMNIDYYVEDWD